jgi:hypothetical protein
MPDVPLITPLLAQRLVDAELLCLTDWLRAMEAVEGNPFGVVIKSFGGATALVCSKIPAAAFNRVFNMTVDDRAHIPAIQAFYAEHDTRPLFDLNPYAAKHFSEQPNLTLALAQAGFYQGGFHQLLYGVPTLDVPPLPDNITIQEVGTSEAHIFGQIYEEAWESDDEISMLVGQPHFRCYVAYVDGEAAALGVLHVANGVGSMATGLTLPRFRSKGCQTALLYRRIQDAALAGCDLLVSQCLPGASSQTNQLRVGMRVAGTKVWWLPMPKAER